MDYFKHDINASEDDKICDLLAAAGYELLGYYWRFVEYLYSRGGKVARSKIASVAWSLHMDREKLEYLISEFNLFIDDGENIFSRRVVAEVEEFEANGKRMADIGRIGGKASAKARAKAKAEAQGQADALADGQANAQQNKKNKTNKIKKEKDSIVDSVFESLWKQYPKKQGKQAVTKKAKDELVKAGEEVVLAALGKYKEIIQRDGTAEKYIMNGSTFFNGRWTEFIEAEEQSEPMPQPQRRKSF